MLWRRIALAESAAAVAVRDAHPELARCVDACAAVVTDAAVGEMRIAAGALGRVAPGKRQAWCLRREETVLAELPGRLAALPARLDADRVERLDRRTGRGLVLGAWAGGIEFVPRQDPGKPFPGDRRLLNSRRRPDSVKRGHYIVGRSARRNRCLDEAGRVRKSTLRDGGGAR